MLEYCRLITSVLMGSGARVVFWPPWLRNARSAPACGKNSLGARCDYAGLKQAVEATQGYAVRPCLKRSQVSLGFIFTFM